MALTISTLVDARDYIQGIINEATNAPVFNYERRFETMEDLRTNITTTDDEGNQRLHGWTITVESDSPESDSPEGTLDASFKRVYHFVLRGYFSLDDSQQTGAEWQEELEDIHTKLDNDPTLGGNCIRSDPCVGRVRDEHRVYGSVLCHYAEIALSVEQRRDRL